MRYIIKAVPWRKAHIAYLKRNLPDAEWCMDRKKCAMDTHQRALAMAGDDPCVHMEEDILLTQGFQEKIEAAIAERPDKVIQFFSMRKADLTVGSRLDRNFMMTQCVYYPAGYSALILEHCIEWYERPGIRETHPSGTDTQVGVFLKERREDYWIHVPSLVDHRVCKSAIDPRRSSKRQSLTFKDPIWSPGA